MHFKNLEFFLFPLSSHCAVGVGIVPVFVALLNDSFEGSGLDFKFKTVKVENGEKLKMMIFDTAGQERYKTIATTFYKGALGVLLVYAVNERKSFLEVEKWISEIRNYADEKIVVVLAGNKSDLEGEREVQKAEGKELAEKYGFPFGECSAMKGYHVTELFQRLASEVAKNMKFLNRNKETAQLTKGNSKNSEEKNENSEENKHDQQRGSCSC